MLLSVQVCIPHPIHARHVMQNELGGVPRSEPTLQLLSETHALFTQRTKLAPKPSDRIEAESKACTSLLLAPASHRPQYQRLADFPSEKEYAEYVKGKLLGNAGMRVRMLASPSRPSKIAAGAVGRFIPNDKLPHAVSGAKMAMVHWESTDALHAAKWSGVARGMLLMLTTHRHDLELVAKDKSSLPKLPTAAPGAFGFGGFGAPAAEPAEPTFGTTTTKVTDPEKMLEALEEGEDDDTPVFEDSEDDADGDDDETEAQGANDDSDAPTTPAKEPARIRYLRLPAVQFANALASYIVGQMLQSVDNARATQSPAGLNVVRDLLATLGTSIATFAFRGSLPLRASGWYAINAAATATDKTATDFFKAVGLARMAIRVEEGIADVLQFKSGLRAKFIALAEQNVASLTQLSLSMSESGFEELLRSYAQLRDGQPSDKFTVKSSRTRQLCRLFSSSRSVKPADLGQIERVWAQTIEEAVSEALNADVVQIKCALARIVSRSCYAAGRSSAPSSGLRPSSQPPPPQISSQTALLCRTASRPGSVPRLPSSTPTVPCSSASCSARFSTKSSTPCASLRVPSF